MRIEVNPTLSIITVTYNAPEALAATLDSLRPLETAGLAWELVVVDSSPNRNASVLSGWRGREVLRHVVQDPAGIYAAMNAGIETARGEYLWFLNGGDRLTNPAALKKVILALESEPSRLFAQAAAELRRDGAPLYVQRPTAGLRSHLGINRICHQAIIYRREFFLRVGLYSSRFKIAADYELHLRAIAANHWPLPVNEVIAIYDMGGQSSNVEAALKEFNLVHTSLQTEGKLSYRTLHSIAFALECGRQGVIRKLDQTPFGSKLRALRHWLRSG